MDLKARARKRGIKQKDLAEFLGVSEGTMSKWLNRDVPIPPAHMRSLARKLGIRLNDLLPLEQEQ